MKNYKIIRKNQFACSIMQVRRDKKMPVAILKDYNEAIISQAYPVFRVVDETKLLPDYLMMWMSREEFDREACFLAVGGVRGSLEWEDFLDMELPIPSIEKQREIVAEYNAVVNRIELNEQINQKLEETAKAIYRQWFEKFEFPISQEYAESIGKPELEGQPYKSSGGEMVYNEELDGEIPKGWVLGTLEDIAMIEMGQSPKGSTYNYENVGLPLINGPVEFGNYFPQKSKWTSSPTKLCEKGDLIVCVRGSTVGRYVKSDDKYCIGRGVCAIKGKVSQRFVDELYKQAIQEITSLTTGSTFPNLNNKTISTFTVIIPKKEILSIFEKIISIIYELVETKSYENRELNSLQALLLSKMSVSNKEMEMI